MRNNWQTKDRKPHNEPQTSDRRHGAFSVAAVRSPLPASRLQNQPTKHSSVAASPGALGRRRRRRNQMLNNHHRQLAPLLFATGLLVRDDLYTAGRHTPTATPRHNQKFRAANQFRGPRRRRGAEDRG